MGPDDDQERDRAPTVGEVDVDVSEVRLEAAPRGMGQRDEGGARSLPMRGNIAPHRGVGAEKALLVLEPPVDLRGGVPLLGRGVAVVAEDLVDDRREGLEYRQR